jgi:hypothetical protein
MKMQVTEVDIAFAKPRDGLVAFASVVLDDQVFLSEENHVGAPCRERLHICRRSLPLCTRESALDGRQIGRSGASRSNESRKGPQGLQQDLG